MWSEINNGCNNHAYQPAIQTREDMANILRKFERQREEQRGNSYRGQSLPEATKKILDSSSAHNFKKDLGRYKRQIPKYNHEDWTTNEQISKELNKWKVAAFQVVNTMYTNRPSETAGKQERAQGYSNFWSPSNI
ncbi:hypothetical protein [Parasitella parasitica]|uniref:Uncharacterized protein n=1 Tax=Parasitella parasitica TaxID=35722 RepID=A0A0B7N089_9FUNG|nr:hypothetical protein [Parasitella parasitica]